MKILFVVASYGARGAGSGISVQHLAESCSQAGHDVAVMHFAKDGKPRREIINNVRVYHRRLYNLYGLGGAQKPWILRALWHGIDLFNPLAAWDFYRILRRKKPDIVNTNIVAGFSTSLFYVVKVLRIKLVHTLRDYYLMCPQNAMFRGGKSCDGICKGCQPFWQVRRRAAALPDAFLANSAYIAARHTHYKALPRATPCLVQYNMNGDDHIDPPRQMPGSQDIRFGFIGRLVESKGLETLLRAVKNLELENWSLKIAGLGQAEYISRLKAINDDPRILYLGQVESEKFYSEIDVLICPSLYEEPLPRVVYEAYRAALPVIATKSGGTPEIVEEGKTGFLYAPMDEQELAAHMGKLAGDPALYARLSRGASEKARLFTKSHISAEFLARLHDIVEAA